MSIQAAGGESLSRTEDRGSERRDRPPARRDLRRRLPAAWLAAALAAGAPPLLADARSTELMRYECSSTLSRRDVTLFANGTVRLRQGPWDDQALTLDELRPEVLAGYVRQLRDVQSSQTSPSVELPAYAPSGDWVERCEIRLALPGAEPRIYAFTAYEVPPLVVAGLIHVAEDLADFTRALDRVERLPEDYRPRPGDLLRGIEGGEFRVVGLTSDGLGVELEERGTPVMIVVPVAQLRELFSALLGPARR